MFQGMAVIMSNGPKKKYLLVPLIARLTTPFSLKIGLPKDLFVGNIKVFHTFPP